MALSRLSRSSCRAEPLPVKLLVAALLLTIAVLIALGWFISAAHRDFQKAHTRHSQLDLAWKEVIHLDEVLTMSAYVAAATGDSWWWNRYRCVELRLRAATQKIEGLAPNALLSQVAARTDAAKVKLRAMEADALEPIRQDDRDAGRALLNSDGYKKQRGAYMRARRGVGAEIERLLRATARDRRRAARHGLVSVGVVLPLLVVVWLAVVKTVRAHIAERQRLQQVLEQAREELERQVGERTEELHRANEGLQTEIAEREQAQTALRRAHAELEQRVKERTAELSRTNASLRQEIERRRQVEEDLGAAKSAAERASRAKSDFLGSMSHELRTPLSAVIGFSQILKEQHFGSLNELQADYVGDILESGQHLLSLINDILDLSKIEAGKMTLTLSAVKLRALLEHSMTMIREKCTQHGIRLDLDVPEALRDLVVTADQRKLKQLVFNLLSNAAKFTPDGGRITIGLTRDSRGMVVSVSDTGIGVPPQEQENIFEEFYQTRDGSSAKAPGTGLGLSLVRRLARLHGGRVWVESEGRNKGSRFSVWLPLPAGPAQPEEPDAGAPAVNLIHSAEELRGQLDRMIRESKNGRLTVCALRTEPELSKAQALALATRFEKERRPGDYLGVDWTGHVYAIFWGVDAEEARIPCGRMTGRAAGTLTRAKVTWVMAALPQDGGTPDALLGKLGLSLANQEEGGEQAVGYTHRDAARKWATSD